MPFKDKEKEREYRKKYNANHRDHVCIKSKEWREKYPDRAKKKSDKWRSDNKDRVKQRSAKYYIEHKNEIMARNAKRRALLAGAVGTFTSKEWKQMIDDYDHRCAYCHNVFDKLTQDHVVPIIKGGRHDSSNIVPACGKCNSKKGSKDLDVFMRDINA